MQRFIFMFSILAIITLPGCTVVNTIFKAGMWWAFFLVFLVIVVGIWLAIKFKSRK